MGTAGGAADGVSLPRYNWMLKNASTPKIMVVMKHSSYEKKTLSQSRKNQWQQKVLIFTERGTNAQIKTR